MWVLGGRVQRGVAGAVAWGASGQQTLLPKKRLGQGSLVAFVQFSWRVVRASSKESVPASMQQDLVLKGETKDKDGPVPGGRSGFGLYLHSHGSWAGLVVA